MFYITIKGNTKILKSDNLNILTFVLTFHDSITAQSKGQIQGEMIQDMGK